MNGKGKPLIRVKNLRKEYPAGEDTVIALKDISFEIMPGEICCIFGTSGSGKSTLLNQLAGLESPTSGEVLIGNIPISKLSENDLAVFRQKYLGFIFQSYNLMQTMTALENTALPLVFKGIDKKTREQSAKSILEIVGLSNRLNHYPNQMSGGQQQRVGIARAFITKPKIVFADEPTGNLDTKTTIEVMEMIKNFAEKYNQTIILVTHEPELAEYATRVITLADGEIISDTRKEQVHKYEQ
ncbi:MAG: ABC transporter ATP-binding protein [Clostridia bacterium]|nr:ABC transporter ATP-binding protein [Clostridia bacterium]